MPWESLSATVAAKVKAEEQERAYEMRFQGSTSHSSSSQRTSAPGRAEVRPPRTSYPQGNIHNYFERIGINMNPGGPGDRLLGADYDDYSLFREGVVTREELVALGITGGNISKLFAGVDAYAEHLEAKGKAPAWDFSDREMEVCNAVWYVDNIFPTNDSK